MITSRVAALLSTQRHRSDNSVQSLLRVNSLVKANAKTGFRAEVRGCELSCFFKLFTGPVLEPHAAVRFRETSGHQLKTKRGA